MSEDSGNLVNSDCLFGENKKLPDTPIIPIDLDGHSVAWAWGSYVFRFELPSGEADNESSSSIIAFQDPGCDSPFVTVSVSGNTVVATSDAKVLKKWKTNEGHEICTVDRRHATIYPDPAMTPKERDGQTFYLDVRTLGCQIIPSAGRNSLASAETDASPIDDVDRHPLDLIWADKFGDIFFWDERTLAETSEEVRSKIVDHCRQNPEDVAYREVNSAILRRVPKEELEQSASITATVAQMNNTDAELSAVEQSTVSISANNSLLMDGSGAHQPEIVDENQPPMQGTDFAEPVVRLNRRGKPAQLPPPQVETIEQQQQIIKRSAQLGHLATVTALKVIYPRDHTSLRPRFVVTSDRDEKIIISLYPPTLGIITAILVGHKEFITDFVIMGDSGSHLLSCAADGTIRLWHIASATEVACYKVGENDPLPFKLAELSPSSAVATLTADNHVLELRANLVTGAESLNIIAKHEVDSCFVAVRAVSEGRVLYVDSIGNLGEIIKKKDNSLRQRLLVKNPAPVESKPLKLRLWKHNRDVGAETPEQRIAKRQRHEK